MAEKKENTPKTGEKAKAKEKRRARTPLPKGVHRAIPIILGAMAVFTAVCFVMDGVGELGGFLADFLLGLFSYAAYGVPVLLLLHAVFYSSDLKEGRLLSRVIFSSVALIAVSAAVYTAQSFGTEPEFLGLGYYEAGIAGSGGGLIGSLVAYGMTKLFGYVGVIIIALMVIGIYITYFFSGGGRTLRAIGFTLIRWVLTVCVLAEKMIKVIFSFFLSFGKRSERKRSDEKAKELYEDDFFAVDNGIESLEISELGIAEKRSRAAIEARPTLHEKVFHRTDADGYVKKSEKAVHAAVWEGTVYEEKEEAAKKAAEPIFATSADAVFTKDFDPYDLAASEELANRRSTKSAPKSAPTVTEELESISPYEKERERLERELEKKRREAEEAKMREAEERALSEARERARKEAVPVGNTGDSSSEKKKTFEFTETKNESVIAKEEDGCFSIKLEKSEDSRPERYRSEFIENTYGDAPYYTESNESVTLEKHTAVSENTENAAEPFRKFELDDSDEGMVLEFRANNSEETLTVERSYIDNTPELDYEEEDEDISPSADDGEISEEEIPEEEQNPAINGYREMFSIFKSESGNAVSDVSAEQDKTEESSDNESDYVESDYIPFEKDIPKVSNTAPVRTEEKPQKKNPYAGYMTPPIDLLAVEKPQDDGQISAEIRQNTQTLIETLADFNVTASIKGVDRGPRITRYEVVPARGVKVNSITNLFDNIALNLAAEGIRMEAPIPGKSAIGFEIPNKKPTIVSLRSLLECEEFINAKSKTFVCIGKDVAGNPVFGDIAKFPHALVAGATGTGKSVCMNSIMVSMLYKARPDEVKFILIDPKKVEFKMYSGIPHLLIPVITEAKQAAGALMWAVDEMERRYSLIEQHNVRNIEGYNEKCQNDKSVGEPLPKIIIVIDELNDLMMQVRDPVEDLIMRIAQKARAAGIHLLIGTQRPDVKVVTGTIKANINTRIACKVTSLPDSRTILDMAGAEKLLDRGDMLFKPVDKTKPIRVQGCFVSDPEVEAIMEFLKSNNGETVYNEEIFAEINRAAQKCGNKKSQGGSDDFDGDDDDEVGYYSDQQFLDAVELAIRSGKISTSLLQRKLSIGYGKAAKYIDAMEDIGIVSEQNGMKPRDVLISMDEWHEKLSRVNYE